MRRNGLHFLFQELISYDKKVFMKLKTKRFSSKFRIQRLIESGHETHTHCPSRSSSITLTHKPLNRLGEEGSRNKVVKAKVAQSCPTLWPHGLYSPWNSPGQSSGVCSLFLPQEISPTQGSSPGLPHCRRILYQLSHQGSPADQKRCLEKSKYSLEHLAHTQENAWFTNTLN